MAINATLALDLLEADVKQVCTSCGPQLHDKVGPCLQSKYPDLYDYCSAMWNTRCANINGILCYVERLDNWIAKGAKTVEAANDNIDQIPCTKCQAQLIRNEKLFNQNKNATGTAIFTNQLVSNITKNCGANFLDDGKADSNFQVFSPAVVPDTASSSGISTLTIIVAVLGTALFFVLIGVLIYHKWRKSHGQMERRIPRNDNADYDEYFNSNPARMSMSTLGDYGDTAPTTRIESGSNSYTYSKPFN